VLEGTTITIPILTRDVPGFYDFEGWYKEAALTNKWKADDTVTDNITLFAKWTPLKTKGENGTGGGKIFYVDPEGFTFYQTATDTVGITCYYLEAALSGLNGSVWANGRAYIGTEKELGTGRRNTGLCMNESVFTYYAPRYCYNYTGGGKTDWFLPSLDELNQLYINRAYVGNLGTNYYWSSSDDVNPALVWVQHFSDGAQLPTSKGTAWYSRPIRAF